MLRPSMPNVVGTLEGGYPVGVPPVESLSFLRFFGQRRTEVARIEAHNVQNGSNVSGPRKDSLKLLSPGKEQVVHVETDCLELKITVSVPLPLRLEHRCSSAEVHGLLMECFNTAVVKLC
ncbi:hypothetical protein RHSIM_Rhsim02G0073000 [Rhododendron simsii]|uniref:Uncharacterized protein n=1 Tax=Rhododendron simsii TaxID=118357 RepID=A0A834LX11_RHOSS|nr:hypothetical protein RHSIM_Rhsim02G0073000 [Rhododendron simsii]